MFNHFTRNFLRDVKEVERATFIYQTDNQIYFISIQAGLLLRGNTHLFTTHAHPHTQRAAHLEGGTTPLKSMQVPGAHIEHAEAPVARATRHAGLCIVEQRAHASAPIVVKGHFIVVRRPLSGQDNTLPLTWERNPSSPSPGLPFEFSAVLNFRVFEP